jgi:ribosomal protein S18 acetylase RimI-like enzyme
MEFPPGITICHPATTSEFEQYYRIRYETLRKPLGQPPRSERDPSDESSIHALMLDNEIPVGVCRLLFNNESEGQIRSLGVDEKYRGRGLGAMLVKWMEEIARKNGAKSIILHARDNAIPFYEKQGYQIKEKSYLLFGEIQHFAMVKAL